MRYQDRAHPCGVRLEEVRRRSELVSLALSPFVADLDLVEVGGLREFLRHLLIEASTKASREKLGRIGVVDSKYNLSARVVCDPIQKAIGDFGEVANALMREMERKTGGPRFRDQVRELGARERGELVEVDRN